MSTKFGRESRDHRDDEDDAVSIDMDNYKDDEVQEDVNTNTDDGSFRTKQQNRDVEVNVTLTDPMDDYNKPSEPSIGGGPRSVVSPTGTITSDDIWGGSGKHLWSQNSRPSDYSSFGKRDVMNLGKPGGAPKPGYHPNKQDEQRDWDRLRKSQEENRVFFEDSQIKIEKVYDDEEG